MPAREAYYRGECGDCADVIEKGDPVYFDDDGTIICADCARRDGIVCACGGQKKPQYDECYSCAHA